MTSPPWRPSTPSALPHGLEVEHAYGVDDREQHVSFLSAAGRVSLTALPQSLLHELETEHAYGVDDRGQHASY